MYLHPSVGGVCTLIAVIRCSSSWLISLSVQKGSEAVGMSECSSDSESRHAMNRFSRHPGSPEFECTGSALPLRDVVSGWSIQCTECNKLKGDCLCSMCHLCGKVFTEGSCRTHCRLCRYPFCSSCCFRQRYIHILDREKRSVCEECGVIAGLSHLPHFSSSGILWGLYGLKCAADLPSQCVLDGKRTYAKKCKDCNAPVVSTKPHAGRTLRFESPQPSSSSPADQVRQAVEESYFVPLHTVDVEEAEKLMRSVFPRYEEINVFKGVDSSWDPHLAFAAASVAYEYSGSVHASLALSDLPYASLLSPIVSGARLTLLEGPCRTRFVSVAGTHNSRTAMANLLFSQVERRLTIQFPNEPYPRTFSYCVHEGVAHEAEITALPMDSLLRDIQSGYRIVLCGHSLGGSIAAVLTLRLLEAYANTFGMHGQPPIYCFTFGSPLVGSESLQECVEACGWTSQFHHIILDGDWVPPFYRSSAVLPVTQKLVGAVVSKFPMVGSLLQLPKLFSQRNSNDWSARPSMRGDMQDPAPFSTPEVASYSCFGRYHVILPDKASFTTTAPNVMHSYFSVMEKRDDHHSLHTYHKAILLHTLCSESLA